MDSVNISKLKLMAIFCHVIDLGTMRAAARQLGMTPSAVSQYVKQLEKNLGISLIHRSTRKLELSEAGATYYHHCKRMIDAAKDADDAISHIRQSLSGELRITAPVGLAEGPLAEALTPLLDKHPQLQLKIIAGDEKTDLLSNKVDIAIRVGTMNDSNFIYYPLGSHSQHIYAHPGYLRKLGNPVSVEDLGSHQWLLHRQVHENSYITLHPPKAEAVKLRVNAKLMCNNIAVMHRFARQGLGLAILPTHVARNSVNTGTLVKVLPHYGFPKSAIYALTSSRQVPEKVRVVIKDLKEYFSGYQ